MEHDIPRIFGIFIMGQRDAYLTKAVTRTSVYDRDELTEFWDRNHNFYISLPKFKLDKEKITTKDIWLHMFKEMGNMERIDESVYDRADEGLLRLIEKAKVSALSEEEQKLYDASMKLLEDEIDMEEHGYKRGVKDGIEKGIEKGIAKGLAQGRAEGIEQGRTEGESRARQQIVTNLRQAGFSDEKIAEITQIPLESIRKL
ncbi:MAG: PD-(D/E)XK nuclease family transposase [Paludibacteraceae bacterium]|nr:PD-(D/E)XK nuclease family transposase [Paludibacteraceae bacterium]